MAELSYFVEDFYEKVEELFIDYRTRLREDLKKCSSCLTASSSAIPSASNINATCEVRLPQISLPKCNGSYEKWQPFFDLFSSLIHNNSNLSPVQKLHYLKSCLQGEAHNVLQNLPITDANYSEAWLQLIRRYNNKRFNVNEVLKRLFAQRALHNESSTLIKDLLNTTSSCLKCLENMNISTASWDAIINFVVVSKLDTESKRMWELEVSRKEGICVVLVMF
ncbi:unnamed protein product [Leptosia nina]|uniref:Uncharacterized protein n=1 Tax=Leptosia nina TaxID=320188 RepID=A0AAV1JY59_9NEOP